MWYDDKYPQYMGIPADIYDLSIMNARTPNGGQQQQQQGIRSSSTALLHLNCSSIGTGFNGAETNCGIA